MCLGILGYALCNESRAWGGVISNAALAARLSLHGFNIIHVSLFDPAGVDKQCPERWGIRNGIAVGLGLGAGVLRRLRLGLTLTLPRVIRDILDGCDAIVAGDLLLALVNVKVQAALAHGLACPRGLTWKERIRFAHSLRASRLGALRAGLVIANSKFTASNIKSCVRGVRVEQAYFAGVDYKAAEEAVKRAEQGAAWFPEGTDPRCTIVYAARLEPGKGLRELLKAWREAGLAERGCRLVIAGNGPLRPLVEGAKDPSILYVGKLPYERLLDVLAQARAAAAPSLLCESFGRTVAEAAALGASVVAGHRCGVLEVAQAFRAAGGWVATVDPRDTEALASALNNAVSRNRHPSPPVYVAAFDVEHASRRVAGILEGLARR